MRIDDWNPERSSFLEPACQVGEAVVYSIVMQASANTAPLGLAFIVDDEPMLLDLNESALRAIGLDVRRFRAAEQALEAYWKAAVPPLLIVTDYAMHKMTGLELIAACRRTHPDQKFLLISGTVDDSVFRDSPEKPDRVMAKPYLMEDFTLAVRSLVGS